MIFNSPIVSVYYVAENPNKVVTTLAVDSDLPLYEECHLSWTEPSDPGTYYVYWEVAGDWIYSGASTTTSSVVVIPPRDATALQLRTDDIYPSNVVNISFHEIPEARTLSALERYDGIYLDWTPTTKSDERVQVQADNTTVFFDNTQSYFHPSSGAFRVRFAKGSGTDTIYGPWSNTVTASTLPPPPARVEPTAPCDFYLGVNRAGEQIFHMCNPSVVPSAPPTVETGKTATDWFQDWVGINVDYGSDTYFHSMFDYIYCTQAVRLRNYTDVIMYGSNQVRRFDFTGAQDIETGNTVTYTLNPGRLIMLVEVDNAGNRRLAEPALVREIDVTDNVYAVDQLYLGNGTGFGANNAYYETASDKIRSNRNVRYIEVYEFNIQANGLDLSYVNVAGADNGIKLDENTFEVGGNNFNNKFLSYCGPVTDGNYVDSMNLSDAIIANTGNVDSLGIYHGTDSADAIQILGSSGGSGWDITMETGLIKRGGKTWFNAGRGRTRMKYGNVITSDSFSSFQATVPEHAITNNELNTSYFSATNIISNESVIINPAVFNDASILVYALVPVEYNGGIDDWLNLESSQKPLLGFSSFNDRVLIHRFYKNIRGSYSIQPSGDPWWGTWYIADIHVYLRRITDARFSIEYDIEYYARYSSGGQANSIWLPGFALSFVGLS